MEYRNIGGRSNKKYYSNKSNSNRYKFLDNYSNDINQLLSGIANADREIDKLKKEHDKLSRKQMQTLEDIEKQRDNFQKRLNKIGDKTKQNLTSTDVLTSSNESLFRDIQREQNKYKNLSTWYADKQETKLMNRMNAARSQLTTEYINKNAYDSKGNYIGLTSKQTEAMNKEINDKLSKQFSKDIKQFDKSVKAFGTSTSFISDIFKTLLDTTFGMANRALNKQAEIFEETFSNISVRTGISQSQYYTMQRGIRSNLTSRGLLNNVGADELQTMWNSMANNGVNLLDSNGNISDADVYAKAIDYVVTNKIVPYLDTTSKSIQLIDNRVDGKFIRDIRGINLANNELVGNNYMTQDILNKMVDFMEPMSDAALQQLAQSSEEMTLYANKLAAQGLSPDQVNQIINTTFKARNYGYNMLASGSTYEKMIMTDSIVNNINPNNPTQLNDFAAMVAGNNQFWASTLPGYNTALNSVTSSAIGNSVGLDYAGLQTGLKLNEKGIIPGSVQNTNLSDNQVKQYASTAYEEFALKDKNQTNKQLQNVTLGNFMTELAVVKEWMGEYSTVLETAIKSIYNLILTGTITKGIGKLAGLGGAGKGILASGGGIALGAVVAGVIAVEVAKAIDDKKSGFADTLGQLHNEGTVNEGNSVANFVEGRSEYRTSGQSLDDIIEDNGVFSLKSWGAAATYLGSQVGNIIDWGKNSITGNTSGELSDRFQLFNRALREGNTISYDENGNPHIDYLNFSTKEAEGLALAYLLMLDYNNANSSNLGSIGMSHANLISYLQSEDSPSVAKALEYWNEYFISGSQRLNHNMLPIDSNGTPISSLSDNYLTKLKEEVGENWHRYGLSSVPYDNYPAILHQDEAVLTASTANELRNLIIEYRETNHQSINFEAIIQRQTTSLLNKLDSVVNAINNINISTGQTRLSSVQNKLMNSMTTISSTKSFA